MAIAKPQAAQPVAQGVAFGDMAMYVASGGFTLPEGDYIWKELEVAMWEPSAGATGRKSEPFLAVVVRMVPKDDPTAEAIEKPYSMGQKAHLSFQPNPQTGKGIVSVHGGPGQTLQPSTNWAYLLKSLYDCGLPPGVFIDDVSVFEGTWVHMQNIPEPAERKALKARATTTTTMSGPERPQYDNLLSVVGAILDGGAPWDGGGGIPDAAPAKGAKPKVNGAAQPKVTAPPAPAPAEDDDLTATAQNAVAEVLSDPKKANGCTRVQLRMGVFTSIKDAAQKQAVMNSFFQNDESLGALLSMLGYQLVGSGAAAMVQPV